MKYCDSTCRKLAIQKKKDDYKAYYKRVYTPVLREKLVRGCRLGNSDLTRTPARNMENERALVKRELIRLGLR